MAIPLRGPITRLITRCLVKDTKHRLRDIGDAALELADALTANASAATPRVRACASRRTAWLLAAAAVFAAAAIGYQRVGRLTSGSERPAAACVARGIEIAAAVGYPNGLGFGERVMGRIARDRGSDGDARDALARSAETFERVHAAFEANRTRRELSTLAGDAART